jgi:hypothetical protein
MNEEITGNHVEGSFYMQNRWRALKSCFCWKRPPAWVTPLTAGSLITRVSPVEDRHADARPLNADIRDGENNQFFNFLIFKLFFSNKAINYLLFEPISFGIKLFLLKWMI